MCLGCHFLRIIGVAARTEWSGGPQSQALRGPLPYLL